MPPSTNPIESEQDLTDDIEQESVAFLNSGGGDIVIGACPAPQARHPQKPLP
ncbi:hypothetical protein FACS1894139_17700 [Planctomycetales bacterium]|nr:hypothetical protein FACS1894139_17700 [Planctomycetales bacterium]